MISYSETEIFSAKELELWRRTTVLVESLLAPEGPPLRCHEVVRAVAQALEDDDVTVVDGKYGPVEHSWLELHQNEKEPCILDVYAVGRLPMVQLVAVDRLLPNPFRPGPVRSDIDLALIARLVQATHERRPIEARLDGLEAVAQAARRFQDANAAFKVSLITAGRLGLLGVIDVDTGPLVDAQQEAVEELWQKLRVLDQLSQPAREGGGRLRLTVERASRVAVLTFGGRQVFEAKAGYEQPFHHVVEDNKHYLIVKSGLNYYVFERSAVRDLLFVEDATEGTGATS